QHLNQELSKITEGVAFSFSPPAIPGVGAAGGFTFMLEDRAGKDPQFLSQNLEKFLAALRKRPELAAVYTTALPSVPQVYVDVDRPSVIAPGVQLADVYKTLQTFMAGFVVNYSNRFGRQGQVYVAADGRLQT